MKPVPAALGVTSREINHRFYEALWRDARLVEPNRFNTWPLVSALVADARRVTGYSSSTYDSVLTARAGTGARAERMSPPRN